MRGRGGWGERKLARSRRSRRSRALPALIRLQPLPLVLFSGFAVERAISSVVERLLHTQEVAGSNPASRTTWKASEPADPQRWGIASVRVRERNILANDDAPTTLRLDGPAV